MSSNLLKKATFITHNKHFEILFSNNPALYNCFLSVYSHFKWNYNSSSNQCNILYQAKEILMLSDFIQSNKYYSFNYNNALTFLQQASILIDNLKIQNLFIPVFDVEDFLVVIDNEKINFVYIHFNDYKIFNNYINIPLNFSETSFFSPEVSLKTLPIILNNPLGCSVYAIGLMISKLITYNIYGTKLYWAILRALKERVILLI